MTALASDWPERFPFLQGGKLYLGVLGDLCLLFMTDEYEEMYVSSHNKKLLREHSLEVGLTENLDWCFVLPLTRYHDTVLWW